MTLNMTLSILARVFNFRVPYGFSGLIFQAKPFRNIVGERLMTALSRQTDLFLKKLGPGFRQWAAGPGKKKQRSLFL